MLILNIQGQEHLKSVHSVQTAGCSLENLLVLFKDVKIVFLKSAKGQWQRKCNFDNHKALCDLCPFLFKKKYSVQSLNTFDNLTVRSLRILHAYI